MIATHLTVQCEVHFQNAHRGRKQMMQGEAPAPMAPRAGAADCDADGAGDSVPGAN